MTSKPVRVVMAEDSALLREGLRRLLDADDGVDLVAVAADFDELMAAVDLHDPQVVVTDVRMPPTGTDEGVRASEALRLSHPHIGVLLLSQYDEPACARRLLAHGAAGRGYLLKDRVAEPQQLVSAVRAVASGGSIVDPAVVDGLLRQGVESRGITSVQRRVLLEMARGRNEKEAGEVLGLTPGAVAAEVAALGELLGVSASGGVQAAASMLTELIAANPTGARLATVVFTDVVGSTGHLARLGDEAWRSLLRRHDAVTGELISRWGGDIIARTGDGLMALFPSAVAAIAAANAMTVQVAELGLQLRVGVHAGEVHIDSGGTSGIAVHIAARVLAECPPDSVLVTSTVADLLAGSGTTFAEHAEVELKGVPGRWRLLLVTTA
ncbi:MAG TPA: response regulator [Mycobacteriales bacterium]|nr:response regulator [Mycobacteriales bacterium]